jgi:hypothetical protein
MLRGAREMYGWAIRACSMAGRVHRLTAAEE